MTRLHIRKARWSIGLLVIALCLALVGAGTAQAAEQRSGETVIIQAEEVIPDDLYITAQTIVIDGTVQGDVVAAGAQMTINGTIEGDLLAMGQTIIINGRLADDVRVAAAAVQFGPNARIGDDTLAAASSIEQQAGGTIGGDADFFAGQALLAGSIAGGLEGGFGGLELRGTIDKDVRVGVGTGDGFVMQNMPGTGIGVPAVRSGLTVASTARLGGQLEYTSRDVGTVDTQARVGQLTHIPVAPTATETTASMALSLLRRFAVLFLTGALLLWLTPRWIETLASTLRTRPLPSLGWGTAGFVGVLGFAILMPVAAILLMVLLAWLTLGGVATVTGIATIAVVTGVMAGFALLVSYVAQIVTGLVAGRFILTSVGVRQAAEARYGPLAFGVALYVLLRAVPYLGTFLALAVTLFGLGVVVAWLIGKMSSGRKPRAPVTPLMPAPI